MEQTEEVRQIPYTVQKPVVERIVQKIPVETIRWQEEQVVRKIPVQQTRYEYEEKVEPYQVQVQRMATETKTVQVPHTVQKWVQYDSFRQVPRTVTMRVPIDECGNEIVGPTSTYYPPSSSSIIRKVEKKPTPAKSKESKADETAPVPGPAADGEPKDSDDTGKPDLNAAPKKDPKKDSKKDADPKKEAELNGADGKKATGASSRFGVREKSA